MQWHDSFDRDAWAAAVEQAAAGRHAPPAGVEAWGNDVHRGALSLALRDVQAAGVQGMVRLHHGECAGWELPRRPAVLVSNPPWGQRLRGRGAAESFDQDAADGGGGGGGGFSGAFRDGGSDVEAWWDEEADPAQQERARREQARPPPGSAQQRQAEAAAAAQEAEVLRAAWWDLSAFLKRQCAGAAAFLLSGNPEATRGLRLKADRRHPLTVGGVDCRLLQYSIRGVEPAPASAAAAPAAPGAPPAAAAGAAAAADGR